MNNMMAYVAMALAYAVLVCAAVNIAIEIGGIR